ncbi:MAG: FAD-binding oxidoreductase [Candidatus Rokubacteria bacterium]|nr:FAD-binding oxidoreductase [Candidatus Rokubacteria bacterium]
MAAPRRVIVGGAGVVGASVAYFLARRGVAVTVVERSGVACAASGKSGGFLTDDGLPLIGRIRGLAGAYVATGRGPWGMLSAPATGLALAELIVDGAPSLLDLSPFDPARLPPVRRPRQA